MPIFIDRSAWSTIARRWQQIRAYSEKELSHLWDEVKRFTYPQTYYVDLSRKLLDLKMKMLEEVPK